MPCNNCPYHLQKKFNDDLLVMRSGYSKLNKAMKLTVDGYRKDFEEDKINYVSAAKAMLNCYLDGIYHSGVIKWEEKKELYLYASYDNKYMYCSPTKEGE